MARVGLTLAVAAGLIVLAWYLPNRPQNPVATLHAEKFNSLSFAAYRPWESPLTENFPTEAETDADLALLAPQTRAIRTYSALEGPFDVAALAQKHGVKLWQGIWLGGDRAKNRLEMDHAIALATNYPDTIERVIVGNEVLLRRDLPPTELIADIDRVRAAVKQPVAYADVSDFWEKFPEIAPHVDLVLVHLLPYWEDTPTSIDGAVGYVGQVYHRFKTLFPGKTIVIGETGWPSRGRQRRDAVPGLVNETRFLRGFIALSEAEHFDYNFIEAFDQPWKYESEGIVGARWGLFDAGRSPKIPLHGPVVEEKLWRRYAALSVAAGMVLTAFGLVRRRATHQASLAALGMGLGGAFGLACAGALPFLFDWHVRVAACVNLAGQALLAILAMRRAARTDMRAPSRTGADTTLAVRGLLRARRPDFSGAFEDLSFLFVWTAAVLQCLLVFDPRYREFPLTSFAVPLLVTMWRATAGDLPRGGGGPAELFVAVTLAAGAIASAIQEGPLNGQSLVWNMAALVLAGPLIMRLGAWRLGLATAR